MTSDLIMMIGVAGSGKSTWIKNFLANQSQPYTVLSTDDIYVEWGTAQGLNYSESFAAFKYAQVEKEFYSRLSAAFERGDNVIWDQTNLTKESRAKKLARVPVGYTKRAVAFNLPYNVVIARQNNTDRLAAGKVIPRVVTNGMFKQFEAPEVGEFDSIIEIITE